MAKILEDISRTFNEFLLLPNLTDERCIPSNVSLRTPLVKYKKGEEAKYYANLPVVSAIMQSVSGEEMGIALAREGGVAFIYGSQSIENQAKMVYHVKKHKAGFVISDSNVKSTATLKETLELVKRTGHSTVIITDDGTANGKYIGLVTDKDYRISRDNQEETIDKFMTSKENSIWAEEGISLAEANDMIWKHKISCLPILTKEGNLKYLVFRKDYEERKNNPNSLLDENKRYIVGAGINTRDYEERIPALVEAGVDLICMDSSDGFSIWQKRTIDYVREKYGDSVKIGAGNVVDKEGFYYLAEAGADFIKVGVGGGSICITRETKGIGRGQASSLIDVVEARDEYFERTGIYIPICSDGGIVHDHHITIALALGADFVMMGRYFARFDESPTRLVKKGNNYVKEYWGEGSNRARNWQRYDMGGESKLSFEEGVDSYIPYAGSLKDNLAITMAKVKSTMCNCGAITIPELHEKARLTLVSEVSISEGKAHDVILKEIDENYK
ncbi:MAG TPA: IMP dehydrogenase [Candidatus Merdicola faecigallinarum]|uniref:IMP dehydrogenase n=1 Tax=Candidatus Merdicola faecigallinarum TaxID=2840862 RepID=A0A9D1M053_9FIRM|nr:IMP dehydrogenase [Candidatus Merdicola faecigallinarum]